jgi:hypothetical protein
MKILDTLEKKFGHLAISNLTTVLIIGQVMAYLFSAMYPATNTIFILQGKRLVQGEWWRAITFLFQPFTESTLLLALAWYINYIFGTALELIWGSFRYMVYLIIVYILTIVCAFVFPQQTFGNGFLFESIFLAFAYVNPDFLLTIFFVIPIKIKWIAYLTWIGVVYTLITGLIDVKIQTFVSISNFLLYFGEDIALNVINRRNPIKHMVTTINAKQEFFMQCAVCKKTESDKKIFSYCHECVPETQYCEDHIHTHEHVGK